MIILFVLTVLLECLDAVYLYDDDDQTPRSRIPTPEDLEFEPVLTLTKDKEKLIVELNINCDDFSSYTWNCTYTAAMIYNASRKSPPMPAKLGDWCKAIRHLTNCAIDWNSDCKDVTESHFTEESIRGHMHVVNNICDDEWFLSRYDILPICLERASESWENCYSVFKSLVDAQKNTTHEWTHYQTHFYMCCARAQFRRCTLDRIFAMPESCSYEQAVTLQKFSVIVSEGDVFQDCDTNMMYSNCPGGDPRPSGRLLAKLMNAASYDSFNSIPNRSSVVYPTVLFYFFIVFCGLIT